MEISLAKRLEMYIKDETADSLLYRELSKIAPNDADKKLLIEFSEDEQVHAENFQKIYKTITGKMYEPKIQKPEISGSFDHILKDRVLNESRDFRKYAQQYIATQRNETLRDAYFNAETDENVHALRLLYC